MDDLVFETELIAHVEINIDYILMLVKKYHDSNCKDKEVLVTIEKAVNASHELRSKKQLIDAFIASANESDDIIGEWQDFVDARREEELQELIESERLNPDETRRFLAMAFRDGAVKTTGTDIDKLMPPVSRFGGRAAKKSAILDKLTAFFEKYQGIGRRFSPAPYPALEESYSEAADDNLTD